MADSASPGDERTVQRWSILRCSNCGDVTSPPDDPEITNVDCGCRFPEIQDYAFIEVVPVSHLPSEPSPEAIEAAAHSLAQLYTADWQPVNPVDLVQHIAHRLLKERELAERGEDRG